MMIHIDKQNKTEKVLLFINIIMGACNSQEVACPAVCSSGAIESSPPAHPNATPPQTNNQPTVGNISSLPQISIQKQISQNSSKMRRSVHVSKDAQMLCQSFQVDFSIGKEICEMLEGLCFTQSQAKDLIKALVHGAILLQQEQNAEQKMAVKAIFNEKNIQMIVNQQLFYYGALDKLKGQKINFSSKSRIYHTIANLKKNKKVDQRSRNKFKITCIKKNDYKELSQSELQQIIKYQTIADKTKQVGSKIGFKFQSIKKESEKIVNLLSECMKKHISTINGMKYNLSHNQVMKMAQISREACDYYDNGAFILLVYFVQSCKKLEQKSKRPEEIQVLLKKAIADISKKYPPGHGLSHQHEELIKTLKDLQNPKSYNKVDFTHADTELVSTNKQLEVENLIKRYALVAQECKQLLEELIKATCLTKCVYFKIGLKYYPSKPNIKALTRIKQKMFFKKEQEAVTQVQGKNIQQVLQKEQTAYRNIIDEILKNSNKIQFKISDMLRAKCVFLEVADIIYSINQIKRFVARNPIFGIAEIESRFTNKLPISDVTMKIVVKNRIVAELQLTIQTNAATYNFAHKIYELQRSKVFSKLKIIHNYYQELRDDFNELTKKALQLQIIGNAISPQISQCIISYFKLYLSLKSFTTILQEVIEENKQYFPKLSVTVDPLLQHLIRVTFDISIGKWGKDIGSTINNALKNEKLSPKLKSTILSTLFEVLYLPSESENMQQHGILEEQMKQKPYIQDYMRQYFDIQKVLKFVKENSRLYYRAQQLEQIIFYKRMEQNPIQLQYITFVDNVITEEHCFQKIKLIQQLFNFYSVTRKQDGSYYKLFSCYQSWIQDQLKINKGSQAQILSSEVQIIKAQFRLQENQPKSAIECLQNSLKMFKSREQHTKVMECQILLAEGFIKTNGIALQQKIDYYEKTVLKKAKILGVKLSGILYADSLWRISEYLLENTKNKDEKKQILQSFTAGAIQQMSQCKGKQFIFALNKRWKQYETFNLTKPLIKENNIIKYAKFRNIGVAGCENLSKANWKNIAILNLKNNNIGPIGCEYLRKASWENINTLILYKNNIGDAGCEQLSKADWKKLNTLNLRSNNIGPGGCQYLSKANWKNLATLSLYYNNIGDAGCDYLSKADWKNITTMDLNYNNIGDLGCQYLGRASWKNIITLNLSQNIIGALGCQFLSKANWNNFKNLNLKGNKITDKQSIRKYFSQENLLISL